MLRWFLWGQTNSGAKKLKLFFEGHFRPENHMGGKLKHLGLISWVSMKKMDDEPTKELENAWNMVGKARDKCLEVRYYYFFSQIPQRSTPEKKIMKSWLVGGFNPWEKICVKMGSSSPRFGVKIKNLWVATTQLSSWCASVVWDSFSGFPCLRDIPCPHLFGGSKTRGSSVAMKFDDDQNTSQVHDSICIYVVSLQWLLTSWW